jgi:hypothetical protein
MSDTATTLFLRLAETGMPALTMARRLKMEIDEVNLRLKTEGFQQRKIVWLKTDVCWRDYERLHLDTRLNAGQFLPAISREMGRRRNDLNGRLHHMSRRGWSIVDRDRLRCLQAANAGLETMVLELDRTSQAIASEIARSAASADRRAQIGPVGELP